MKKISIMLLAAVVLIGGLLPSTSYAKNDYDKKLQEAIIKVKKLLNISDKYDTFTSNVSSYEGNTNFYLNWTDSTGKLNNIDVNADIEGNIISYNSYSPIYKEPKSKLPNYTKEEAQNLLWNL